MTSSPRPTGPTDDPTRWTRSDRTIFRRLPDGVLVLPLPDGEPELVTGPGGQLWDLVATPQTLSQLTTVLAARYDHDPVVVEHDLRQTIAGLVERQLIAADR